MSSVVAINQRARSTEQKMLRRRAVLEAAEMYFFEVGYEAFSMSKLAKNAGLAKGTLYLYFQTREELFLTLYEQSLIRWSQVFIDDLSDSMTSKHTLKNYLALPPQTAPSYLYLSGLNI